MSFRYSDHYKDYIFIKFEKSLFKVLVFSKISKITSYPWQCMTPIWVEMQQTVRLGLLCSALTITEGPKANGGASYAIYDAIKRDSSCSVCPCAQYQ